MIVKLDLVFVESACERETLHKPGSFSTDRMSTQLSTLPFK